MIPIFFPKVEKKAEHKSPSEITMKNETLLSEAQIQPKNQKSTDFLPKGYQIPPCEVLERYEQEERGDRKHFIRANITMSPAMLSQLKTSGAQLQALGEKDTDVSSLVRCACKELLSKIEAHLANVRHEQYLETL